VHYYPYQGFFWEERKVRNNKRKAENNPPNKREDFFGQKGGDRYERYNKYD
jgi:hypothetical protein